MIPSKNDRRFAPGLAKIIPALVILMVLAVQSCISQVNHHQRDADDSSYSGSTAWEDSLSRLKQRYRPVYLGLDISFGIPRYQLKSNIAVLNNLPVNSFGGMAGGVLANPVGKIKSGIGIYYSGDNVPYTFDVMTANLSVNLYILRIQEVRYHTWEPYIFGGISQMKNRFYGYYLADPAMKINRSSAEPPYIGSVLCTHLLTGAGVEYQLESDNREFIHLYAEISFGSNLRTNATTEALSHSTVPGSLWITIGMSFGKFK